MNLLSASLPSATEALPAVLLRSHGRCCGRWGEGAGGVGRPAIHQGGSRQPECHRTQQYAARKPGSWDCSRHSSPLNFTSRFFLFAIFRVGDAVVFLLNRHDGLAGVVRLMRLARVVFAGGVNRPRAMFAICAFADDDEDGVPFRPACGTVTSTSRPRRRQGRSRGCPTAS